MNWFKKNIGSKNKTEVTISEDVRPGDTFVLCNNNSDPWGGKSYPPVTILDVKDGWVRYYISPIFDDNRMLLSTFTSVYKRV